MNLTKLLRLKNSDTANPTPYPKKVIGMRYIPNTEYVTKSRAVLFTWVSRASLYVESCDGSLYIMYSKYLINLIETVIMDSDDGGHKKKQKGKKG